ncbi:hypothetical protein [Parendozoicomonas haliclonae]|uniref:Uncharacterized protein n=1 Tax=Parendozoicomonas haliclonae TaxID=1960125 RepID=A0A1X7AI06_9GAMM|nr:hypothetical protein [Parendozoicomonas haliclonae]SMA43889.1 hypothetical protein EHSB41UT_01693 [Parendozoicomonas haliclonae]
MQQFHRLITPAILMVIIIGSSQDGDYIIALAASIILGLVCYRLMDSPDTILPFPEIIEKGPQFASFNEEIYPEWIKTEDGHCYTYDGLGDLETVREHPDCVLDDGIIYHGVRYRLEK